MAGAYYVQSEVKLILKIDAADTADDSLLDDFGDAANQHIDNILKIHDEKIPLQGANVLNDIKKAANYHVVSLYYAHLNNPDLSADWLNRSNELIEGIKQEREFDNTSMIAERFMGRHGYSDHDHYFAEW